jgi:hypothetical protein
MTGTRPHDDDATLRAIAAGGPCATYADVIARLQALEAALTPSDGLYHFNRLYREMTAAVIDHAQRGLFRDPVFLERLDCAFAELYFAALAAHLQNPVTAPGAWKPLFEARARRDLLPAQLALAGVNAHINRDLPIALVTTFVALGSEPDRDGARFADYVRINLILEAVQADAKSWLLPGALGPIDTALGTTDDVLQIWSLSRARDAAWVASEVRFLLRASSFLSRRHLESLDKLAGFAGRGLLRVAVPLR